MICVQLRMSGKQDDCDHAMGFFALATLGRRSSTGLRFD